MVIWLSFLQPAGTSILRRWMLLWWQKCQAVNLHWQRKSLSCQQKNHQEHLQKPRTCRPRISSVTSS